MVIIVQKVGRSKKFHDYKRPRGDARSATRSLHIDEPQGVIFKKEVKTMKTVVGIVLVLGCLSPMVFADGILFTGTDELTFAGTSAGSVGQIYRIGRHRDGWRNYQYGFPHERAGGRRRISLYGRSFLEQPDNHGLRRQSVDIRLGQLQPRRRLLQRGSDGFGRKSIPRLLRSVPG